MTKVNMTGWTPEQIANWQDPMTAGINLSGPRGILPVSPANTVSSSSVNAVSARPKRDFSQLNKIYQAAMDSFSRANKPGFSTAAYGYGDISGATPEQMSAFSTAPYGYGNINEYWNEPSGITTLPAATNIVPTAEPTYPTQAELLQQQQDEWLAQNPESAVMPNFQIIGTDLPASEAAGYDVPLWGEGPPIASLSTSDPYLAQIKLKIDAGTATQEEIDLYNSERSSLSLAGGGVVSLMDLLNRRV